MDVSSMIGDGYVELRRVKWTRTVECSADCVKLPAHDTVYDTTYQPLPGCG